MHTPLFLRLPQELHVLVSNNLKEDGSLKALSALSRTSRSLRSSYEPALYLALVREKGDNSLPACDYALMWGARHGSIPVMAQAKAYGADHDKQVKHANGRLGWRHPVRRTCLDSCYGWASALQTAVHNGHVDAVQWLLDQGANVDAGGAENPAVDICRCCNMSDPPSEGRRSIVHLAVCAGHVSTLRVLLERGASLEVAEQIDGEHILHAVLMSELDTYRKDNKQEPLAMLKVVLDHLAQGTTSESARSSALNSVGKRQLTLLQFTIDFFHLEHMREVFALLVRAGASLGPLPSTAEWTGGSPCVSFLLYTLKRYGICNAFYKALDLGAEINGNRPDPVNAHPRWQSPLHFLVRHAEQEPLLQESRLYEGDPSLLYEHEGRGRRHREHVAELLRRGAFLDIQDAEGRTPLGNAMSYGSEHISLNRRLWALKMVKVMLKNAVQGHPVLENGVSEESVAKAKEWMEEVSPRVRRKACDLVKEVGH
ncbi:hypothetical protein B0T20DRAFT_476860 [Sordaria brevicollis]|uniref:Uncharacterized protein n=1 Tax=Sordaria brevicollis TaxID=83679 RepID=A0AAE0UEE4_SORBR|nr:hypothetical protein B0T20DRAFT_476860 [Sordaria brevicollis]